MSLHPTPLTATLATTAAMVQAQVAILLQEGLLLRTLQVATVEITLEATVTMEMAPTTDQIIKITQQTALTIQLTLPEATTEPTQEGFLVVLLETLEILAILAVTTAILLLRLLLIRAATLLLDTRTTT